MIKGLKPVENGNIDDLNEFKCALILSREKGVGASEFKRLIGLYNGKPSVALREWREHISKEKKSLKVSDKKVSLEKNIENSINSILSGDCYGSFWGDKHYPEQLLDMGEPPPVLFSSSPISRRKYAAVVGARHMTEEGAHMARKAAEEYGEKGYAIISGGAAGVDGEAHKQALNMGVYTAAVLGCGINVVYPKSNDSLFKEIRNKGVLISELMPDTQPMKSFFPTRNRIIAGLADVVIVVQAAKKGGSLITARWAQKLGKLLVVMDPPNKKPEWQGNIKLLEEMG